MDTSEEKVADSNRELHKLVEEARSLMRHDGRTGDAALNGAHEELSERLARLRTQLEEVEQNVRSGVRRQAEAADRNIRERPYIALGAAAALGLLAGVLLARR